MSAGAQKTLLSCVFVDEKNLMRIEAFKCISRDNCSYRMFPFSAISLLFRTKKNKPARLFNDSVSLFLCVLKRHWISINYTLINIELKRQPEFFSLQASQINFKSNHHLILFVFAESLMDFTPTDVMMINSISLNLSNTMSATYFHEKKKQMNFSNFHIAIVPEQK